MALAGRTPWNTYNFVNRVSPSCRIRDSDSNGDNDDGDILLIVSTDNYSVSRLNVSVICMYPRLGTKPALNRLTTRMEGRSNQQVVSRIWAGLNLCYRVSNCKCTWNSYAGGISFALLFSVTPASDNAQTNISHDSQYRTSTIQKTPIQHRSL